MHDIHDIVVIGASAGGVDALTRLVSALPSDLPASIFVVMHLPGNYKSYLPGILSREGSLPALHATERAKIMPGHIYIAPPDHHLLLDNGVMRLFRGPKENHSRPAIDPLFRSAAEVYGERVVGVVLSGALYDGTAGLIVIKRHGGIAIVQEPSEATFASMPVSAISRDHPDYVLPIVKIAALLSLLAQAAPPPRSPRSRGVTDAGSE